MSPISNVAATAMVLFGSCASAHMILANPVPYSHDTITNSPLSSSGSNYPCQISGSAATFYSTSGISNSATAGDSITMSFKGSAVHGGGSCQVALSTDMQPSQSTRWSTILSIEGGCPSKDGTSPSTYDVTIPSDIPAGTYSYAWTWTSKESGAPEYYMNCAPITIKAGSGSKKRFTSIRGRSDALNNYPPLAVYNMADVNSCKSVLSSSALYPDPGTNVQHLAASSPEYANITGTDCFAKGVSYDGSSSSSSSSSSGTTGASTSSGSSSDGDNGSSGIDSTSSAAQATGAPSGFLTSLVAATTTAAILTSQAATGAPAAPTGSGSGSSSSSGSASSSSSSSGSQTAGSACSEDGEYTCLGGSNYQICASGVWTAEMSVAAGTECSGSGSSFEIAATSSKTKKRAGLLQLR